MNTQASLAIDELQETGALAIIEKKNVAQYFAPKGLDPVIERVRAEVEAFKPDISTEKGRKEIASFAYKVAKSKTALDTMGKELVAGMKSTVKAIDEERARAWDEIEKLQHQARKPLTDWENAEKERVAKHEAAIGELSAHGMGALSIAELQAALDGMEAFKARDWQEFSDRASAIIATRTANLSAQIAAAQKAEADRLELERLQKEEAERKRKAEEERIAHEAADKARKEAEEKAAAEQRRRDEEARAAQEKVEREKREAEEREAAERKAKEDAERRAVAEKAAREQAEADAKAAAEKAESARIAAEAKAAQEKKEAEERAAAAERKRIADEQAAIAAETARREADAKHKKSIMKMAIDALESQIKADPDLDAEGIIKLIADGKIPNIKITY